MRRQVVNVLSTLSSWIERVARRVDGGTVKLTKVRRDTLKKWYADKGDKKHRLDLPELSEKSIVFDVGGHVGQWASDIYCRYSCHIFIFEPVKEHLIELHHKFSSNHRIRIEPVGLSGSSKTISISCEGVASSVFTDGRSANSVEVQLIDVNEYCKANAIDRIDLMKINIEGGEYELLDAILDSNLINRIGIFHIQFHDFVPDAEKSTDAIREKLKRTHECKWVYPFVWECWAEKASVED